MVTLQEAVQCGKDSHRSSHLSALRPGMLRMSISRAKQSPCVSSRGCCRRLQISTEVLLSVLPGCSHIRCACSAPALLQTDRLPSLRAGLGAWEGGKRGFAFPALQRALTRSPANTVRSWGRCTLQSSKDGKCHVPPQQAQGSSAISLNH